MMKLWELRAKDPAPDTVIAFVVRAEHATAARMLAREEAGGEGSFIWLDPKHSSCAELKPKGDAGIVLTEYLNV